MDVARVTTIVALVGAAVVTGTASGPSRAQGAALVRSVSSPAAERVLFREDFEDGGPSPTLVTASGRYAADPAWTTACNGDVVAHAMPASEVSATTCTEKSAASNAAAFAQIRELARALGTGPVGERSANHALAGYTDGADPGADRLVLGTRQPIALPSGADAHFLAVRLRTAAVNCDHPGPRYRIEVVDGAGHPHETGEPLDGCAGPGPVVVGEHRTGAVLVPGRTAGLHLRNANGSGTGNDGAIDDLALLDVTPTLRPSFSPTSVAPGGSSTLTFTVLNTSEAGTKPGFSVIDELPAGLRVDAVPAFATTCTDADLTAVGASTLRLHGSLAEGQELCTFSLRVRASVPGSSVIGAGYLHDAAGLEPVGSATLQVRPVLELRTSARTVSAVEVEWTFEVTNTGPSRIATIWVVDDTAGPVVCPTGPVLPGRTVACRAHAPYVPSAGDVRRGVVRRTTAARGPGVSSVDVRTVTRLR